MKLQIKVVLKLVVLQSLTCFNFILCQQQVPLPPIAYNAEDVAFKTGAEIATMRNFRSKDHYFKTADGYILHALRVINPLIPKPKKIPVIFVHGVLLSMTSYLINSRNVKPLLFNSSCPLMSGEINLSKDSDSFRSLPLLLANFGYDPWLLDIRGVGESNSTTSNLTLEDANYWSYNLDNLVEHDFNAMVSYVLSVTKANEIGYVGHSQATFMLLASLTLNPSLNDIIKPAVALAPIAYLENLVGLTRQFANYIHMMYEFTNHREGRATATNFREVLFDVCKNNKKLCSNLQTNTNGVSDMTEYPYGYASHLGFPTSNQNVDHYFQLLANFRFSRYDHGAKKNFQKYFQSRAPDYNLAKITNKYLVFVCGQSDSLSTPPDIRHLISELRVKPFKEFFIGTLHNHMDMLVSESAGRLINKPLLEIFESLHGCNPF